MFQKEGSDAETLMDHGISIVIKDKKTQSVVSASSASTTETRNKRSAHRKKR